MADSEPTHSPGSAGGPSGLPDRMGADEGELPPFARSLLEGVREGRRSALARAISLVENEGPGFQTLLHLLLSERPPRAARVGITGPPGAGKSSLLTEFARLCRRGGEEVGVVAVDPTSPYSGGALLGDRIRMNELATDPGIFIRSMASRGSLGGLATTTKEVIDLMDGYGFPRLLVETVGVGQTELEITGAADTVVVVLVPESGDGVQAMKAGLMEIADIFVVNKADRPGADRLVREIRGALKLRAGGVPAGAGHHGPARAAAPGVGDAPGEREAPSAGEVPGGDGRGATRAPAGPERWVPRVLLTTAPTGEGVEELIEVVEEHRAHMEATGELERRRRDRMLARVRDVMDREAKREVRRLLAPGGATDAMLDRIQSGRATPYSEAARVLGAHRTHTDSSTESDS